MIKPIILVALLMGIAAFAPQFGSPLGAQVVAQQSPLDISPQLAIVGDAQAITLTCQDDTFIIIQVIDTLRAFVSCQAGSLTVLDPSIVATPAVSSPSEGVGRSALPVGDLAQPAQETELMPNVTPTMHWRPDD